jgi:hypothetical protein
MTGLGYSGGFERLPEGDQTFMNVVASSWAAVHMSLLMFPPTGMSTYRV